MATTSKSTAHKSAEPNGEGPNIPDFSAFLSSFTKNVPANTLVSSWQAYMTGATEMNREFMRFVATRLQHDVELSQSLAQCRDWQVAADLHREWQAKMSDEYAGEAKTLMEIASSTVQESWAAVNGNENAQAEQSAKK